MNLFFPPTEEEKKAIEEGVLDFLKKDIKGKLFDKGLIKELVNYNPMKEEDKYYTPSIEEFHVGFEYEVKGLKEWNNHIVLSGEDIIEMETLMKRSLNPYRVKYLDKEDIEDLGFKFISNGWWSTHLVGDGYQILWEKGKKLNLSYGQHEFSTVKFDGMIKNKSELKKLMKQLNIEING